MITSYFTFGQGHVHTLNGVRFDKDCVAKITAEDPVNRMEELFGVKWASHYSTLEQVGMGYYPRGVIEIPADWPAPAKKSTRDYLGDGVYVEEEPDQGGIRLTTEDGLMVTNEIFLEPSVLVALTRHLERMVKEGRGE